MSHRFDDSVPQPLPIPPDSPPFVPRFSVRTKFTLAMVLSLAWFALTAWIAIPWMRDLAALANWPVALFVVGGIALVPGLMNAFLATSLLIDKRPPRRSFAHYPGISILIAAFNEERSILETLESIALQNYPGDFEVLVIDDGSTDRTARIVETMSHPWLRLVRQTTNLSKSAALNRGLAETRFDLIVTLDADCSLHTDALRNLVERYLSDPPGTKAVAGTMLVRNSRENWVTRAQEWDYFHGIAAVKRMQSLFHGTLVAQGAFSIYERAALNEVGGWDECVGEDIVLTWAMLERGWRIGHAEDACCFTNVPDRLTVFVSQRRRWARGMMEAFRRHPRILLVPRMSTFFVGWNLLFPWLDFVYTAAFIPGLILALFGIYWIAGPMTLALLPMALLMNALMYRISAKMFDEQGLRVRSNISGFLVYVFAYSLVLQPVSVAGYISELLGLRKNWGTKLSARACVVIAALFGILAAGDARAQTAVTGTISATSDAEEFDALRLRTGALFDYASPFDYAGVAAQTTHYTQSGWSRDAPAILVLWRKQDRDTLAGTIAEAGVVRIAGRTRLIGDATWTLRPSTRTGFELLVASDLVETQRALEDGTTHTLFGISAERQLSPRFTAIGFAAHQRFTDGNERQHLRGRLIWMLLPDHGISAQIQWRQFESGQLDAGGAYFNPDRYRHWQAALAMRKRSAGWLWTGTLAAGSEQVDRAARETTMLADLRAEGTLGKKTRLVLHASYNRSAGFAAADGYWYRVVGVSVVVPF